MNGVIIIILDNLDIKEIIKCELICHNYKFIIRNYYWINKQIRLKSINIDYVLNNYNFKNIKINPCRIHLYINKLKNCHTLDLSDTNITDVSVKELKNCHTLNLYWCKNITDDSIKELKNCHTLNLSRTKITDEGVKELKNCHTLKLSFTKITDVSVKELKNCHTLYIYIYIYN
jgi:Leucine-rich repeat (LRR) protein